VKLQALSEAESARVGEVFDKHQAFVESVARRFAPAPMHVPDIVQAVGVQVCRGLNGFRQDAEITTWLYRITKNAAMDLRRRERAQILQARRRLVEQPQPDRVVDPDDIVHEGQRMEALHQALGRMRPKQQEAIRRILGDPSVLVVSRSTERRAKRTLKTWLANDPRMDS
jgi:RNA polymerase sigma-70 factor (ECF subfamily)